VNLAGNCARARLAMQNGLVFAAMLVSFGSGCDTSVPYVRQKDRTGQPVRWMVPEVVLRPYRSSADSDISDEVFVSALRTAASRWDRAEIGCSALRVRVGPLQDEPPYVRADGVNAVVIKSQSWCPDGERAKERCHDPALFGLTTLHTRPAGLSGGEGEIVEADIELNAVHHRWGERSAGTAEKAPSLILVLTHEIGHLVGLDHPCRASSSTPHLDNEGHPTPVCRDALPAVRSTVMYPTPDVAGRAVAEPTAAERRALCSIYPSQSSCAYGVRPSALRPSNWGIALVLGVARLLRRKPWKTSLGA
jgi:hypothetical protein